MQNSQKQGSTMDLVKRYIQENKLDSAKALAKKARGNEWKDIYELFLSISPEPIELCKECGNPLTFKFMERNFDWNEIGCNNCNYQKAKNIIKSKHKEYMVRRGISKRYLIADLKDFSEAYSKEFKNGKSIFIYGPRGTGKTHFMAAMMKHEILNAEPLRYINCIEYDEPEMYQLPIFITVPELLLKIRETFNNKHSGTSSESEIIDRYSEAEILYLDDLGTEKTSDWAIQVLYLIIDRRYSDMKRTVISSNLNLNEIADKLDDRISSRIAGMCEIIQMAGSDRRINK